MDHEEEKKQYKQKIAELVNRPEVIPGIHNYCDRWCERCPFTKRCTVYLMEQELGADSEERDLQNKKFWDRLSLIYEVTMDLVRDSASEMGINLDDVDLSDIEAEPELPETDTEKTAKLYSHTVLDWLKKNVDSFTGKAQLFAAVDEEQLVSFADALDVIRWYSIFIATKTHRALHNMDDDFRDDSLGSAKIALIAVDRSIAAFTFLYHHLPEHEDELIKLMALLSNVKKGLLQSLPDAMAFIRPGFDEEIQ